jgi:hypothetical protein
MSSIRAQDRASLCAFTFADGRRCRTPLSSGHPRLCFDHARKHAQAHASDPARTDLSFSFSGDSVSASDLGAAIADLLPAGDQAQIKPKTTSTLACLSRTLLQAVHLSQHEFIPSHVEQPTRRPAQHPKIPPQ